MRYSKFNTIIDKKEDLIIYNSLSGALLKISKDKIEDARNILIEKGILIENDKDETILYKYIYYQRIFSNKIINITIAPTTDCNLRCPYCFEGENKHKEYMDNETIDSITKYLISKKGREIHLTWFGGEPLLCFDKIIELTDKLNSNDIHFSASIVTNGTLLNDPIVERLYKLNLNNIQITFDGEKDIHDKKRFFKNGKGTYDLIIKNIDNILEKTTIPLILKINIDKTNYKSCTKLFALLKNKYSSYIERNRLKISSNYIRNITNFEGNDCLTEYEYLNFYTQVEQRQIPFPNLCLPCPLRNRSDIVIGPDGSIYKCLEFLGNKSKSIGNIKKLSISISKMAECALSYDPFEDKECMNCAILPICGGGCPNNRAKKALGEDISLCPSIKRNLPIIIENMFNEQKI